MNTHSALVRVLILCVFSCSLVFGQYTIGGPRTAYGTQDNSNASVTKPFTVGSSLPGTCTTGQAYFLTSASAGSNYYGCTATNTWTVQSGGTPTSYTFSSPFVTAGSIISLPMATGSQNGFLSSADWTRFDAAATGTDLFAGSYNLTRTNSYETNDSHGDVAMTKEFFISNGDYQYSAYGGKIGGKVLTFNWYGGRNMQNISNQGDKYTFQPLSLIINQSAQGQNGGIALVVNHNTVGDDQVHEDVITQFGRANKPGDEGMVWHRLDIRDGQGNTSDWLSSPITGVTKSSCAATQATGGLAYIVVNNAHTGTGYTSAPTVTISGGGGSGATATATVSGGSIASLTLTSPGTGYSSQPTVTFSGGGGSGAQAITYLLGYVGNGDSSAANGAMIVPITVDSTTNCSVGDWMYLAESGHSTIPSASGDGYHEDPEPFKITSVDSVHNILYGILRGVNYAPGTAIAPATVISGSFGKNWGTGLYVMNWSKAIDGGTVTSANGTTGITQTSGTAYTNTMVGGSATAVNRAAANIGCIGLQAMGNGFVNDGSNQGLLGWWPLAGGIVDSTHLTTGPQMTRQDGYDMPPGISKIAPCSMLDAVEADTSGGTGNSPNITKLILQPNPFTNWQVGDVLLHEVAAWNAGYSDTNVAFEHLVTTYLFPAKEMQGSIVKNQGNNSPIFYAGRRLTPSPTGRELEIAFINPFAVDVGATMAGSVFTAGGRIRMTPTYQFPSFADLYTYVDATVAVPNHITGATPSTHLGRDGKVIRWHNESSQYQILQQYPETGDLIVHRGQGNGGTTDNWTFQLNQTTGFLKNYGRHSVGWYPAGQMSDTDKKVEISMHVSVPLAANGAESSAGVDTAPGISMTDTRGYDTPSNTYVAFSTVTAGNPTQITIPNHGISSLKHMSVYVTNGTGNWAAINGPQAVTVIDANTISIPVDSTSFGSVTGPPQTYIPHTGLQLEAPGSVQAIELQAMAQTANPGCSATADLGKFWFDSSTSTTVLKVCVSTSGTVAWKTATLQ